MTDADDLGRTATCSVEEAAHIFGISRGLAYELARRGELPGVLHLGRRVRVSVAALRRALDAALSDRDVATSPAEARGRE